MAKSYWIRTDKSGGDGSTQVNVSVENFDGRIQRSGILTVTSAAPTKTVTVIQKGAGNIINAPDSPAFSKEVITYNIVGTSNAKRLSFDLEEGSDEIGITLPETYIVNDSLSVDNNEYISNDPGSSGLYTFNIQISVASPTLENLTKDSTAKMFIRAYNDDPTIGGQEPDHLEDLTVELVLVQSAQSPFLDITVNGVSITELIFENTETTKTIQVSSNVSWTIS